MAEPKFEHLVDDHVRDILKDHIKNLWKQNLIPEKLEKSLRQASKSGSGEGRPDFAATFEDPVKHKDISDLVVIIENKYGTKYLEMTKKDGTLSTTTKAIKDYALNGAVHYARHIMKDDSEDSFKEVIAIGIAGELNEGEIHVEGKAYYFFSPDHEPKPIDIKLDVLLSRLADDKIMELYDDISLTDKEKNAILEKSYDSLKKTSKELNRIFYDYSFPVDERVVIVSGMLLAMEGGLRTNILEGNDPDSDLSDGKIIYRHISHELRKRNMPSEKREMMLSTFSVIKADRDRDARREGIFRTGSRKGKPIPNKSINKEIFDFIYENVYKVIDRSSHLGSYSGYVTYTSLSKDGITLPVTPTGEPDWDYMENYIRRIEKQERENRALRAAQEEHILKQLASRM